MRAVVSLLALTLPSLASSSQESDSEAQIPIVASTDSSNTGQYVCQHPPYKIQIVSSSPLVIYIKDFLTEKERAHLKEVSKSSFRRSAVSHKSGTASSHRTSKSTYLRGGDNDPIVACIESRAVEFQGHDVSRAQLEPLQLVRYSSPHEYYRLHTDWFENEAYKLAINGGNRLSSFFAYVHVRNDTTGGGTNFPLVSAPKDEKWCDVVDCDEQWDKGVTFRPVEGNAIYWENLYPDGSGMGNHRTVHAGLPVTSGDKIGMNIWTRQVPLSEEARASFQEYPHV